MGARVRGLLWHFRVEFLALKSMRFWLSAADFDLIFLGFFANV